MVKGLFSRIHFLSSTPTLIRYLGGPVYWLCWRTVGYINICTPLSQQCSITGPVPREPLETGGSGVGIGEEGEQSFQTVPTPKHHTVPFLQNSHGKCLLEMWICVKTAAGDNYYCSFKVVSTETYCSSVLCGCITLFKVESVKRLQINIVVNTATRHSELLYVIILHYEWISLYI